jgi:ABC transporter DrrB family efflux protein
VNAPAARDEDARLLAAESDALHRRVYWAVQDALVITQRTLRHIPRSPELLVFATVQPVMFVLLFRYVFGGAIKVGGGTSYVNFLMAGIFVQTVAFGALTTGVGLAEDLTRGLIDRFRSLPMARVAVVLGRTLADLVRNTFVVIVMLVVGLAVGFRPHGSALGWLAGGALLLLLSFSFSWIGATIGLAVRNVEAVQSAGFIWLFPLTFASSAFVPTASMPSWLRTFSNAQPITKVVDAVRAWVLGQPVGSNGWIALAWCVGILVVFMPLSVRVYRRAATKA